LDPTRPEYLLSDGLRSADLRALLAERLTLADEAAPAASRTYYDTFDGRLRAAGLELVHADGRLAAVDAAGREVAGIELARAPEAVRAADLPELADALDVRAATRIARVRVRRRALRVLDGERKTVVRIALEDAGEPLSPRLLVRAVRGYDKALRQVRGVLEDDLGLVTATRPLADDAVAATGGVPGGVSSKLDVALDGRARADTAAVIVATRLLETIEANVPGTLADIDPEFLHDLRVAVRRTRALQRELKRVFPPAELAALRDEFRWLQQITGPTRDLDVHLLELEEATDPGLAPLQELLAVERRRAQRRMARALRSDRTREALDGWRALLAGLGERPDADRPDAGTRVAKVAAKRIRAVYRQMVAMGEAIGDDTPAEALHDLRKKGKELRYLLEFFASLFPESEVTPMVKTLKALQDTLGRFQDHEVQAAALRALGKRVIDHDEGAGALMAMGVVVARLEAGQVAARAEFAERFAPFASSARRKAVEATFR
jgi:CHAD domain-containing protein